MQKLHELIEENKHEIFIKDGLRMSQAQWENLLTRLKTFCDKSEAAEAGARAKDLECYDEQIWTFLIACGYAAGGKKSIQRLCAKLSGKADVRASPIWMEALPYPPRHNEGNTNLDFAFGAITNRATGEKESTLGIEYDSNSGYSDITFCEMKWYSDISKSVTHHQQRNQLARVIENALTFQDANGNRPSCCTVTLVTPAVFKQEPKSRLYHYKYNEYRSPDGGVNAEALIAEFDRCDQAMEPRRDTKGWNYPDSIEHRLSTLRLNWVTFEHLIFGLPDNPLGKAIRSFAEAYNHSGKRQ